MSSENPETKPKINVTSHSIRMQSPSSKRRVPKRPRVNVVAHEVIVTGFIDFIREHGVVSLAVGFVIATQVQAVVKLLVSSFITPTFKFFFKNALENEAIIWHVRGRDIIYNWGQFANGFINLVFVLIAIYLIVKIFQLDKLNKPKA